MNSICITIYVFFDQVVQYNLLLKCILTSQSAKASSPLIPYTPAAVSESAHCHTE